MSRDLAPIALFVYNRPHHTKAVVESLLANPEAKFSDLYVFSDGPKTPSDQVSVDEVREYLKSIKGFRETHIVSRVQNLGLAKSIITGVTELVDQFGRVIVMEDDLVSSKYLLSYMNEALNKYALDERVISIHAYNYPVKAEFPETFFLRGASCWGWATWKRGWDLFNPDGRYLLGQISSKNLISKLEYDGAHPYLNMLKMQVDGKINSWAIRWHASAILADKLTLYPGRSLIENIGHDGSGTHCDSTDIFKVKISESPVTVSDIPVEESPIGIDAYRRYYHSMKITFFKRVVNKIKKIIKL